VGAAAASSQQEEPESTPWGWIAFAILAAGVLGAAIFWLVKRGRGHDSPSPGPPAAGDA
jgi:high-affinity Fe2+/Pb2+ permease